MFSFRERWDRILNVALQSQHMLGKFIFPQLICSHQQLLMLLIGNILLAHHKGREESKDIEAERGGVGFLWCVLVRTAHDHHRPLFANHGTLKNREDH